MKSSSKKEKERKILIELVDLYIKTGRAVGSQALRSEALIGVSSATIRNYFSSLEEEGYVTQQHTSGGRIPEDKAYHIYAAHCREQLEGSSAALRESIEDFFKELERTEVVAAIQQITAYTASQLGMATVCSAPRFDRDSIVDIKYVYLDTKRLVSIVVTEFGLVHTSVISMDHLTPVLAKKAEHFARVRLLREEEKFFELAAKETEVIRAIYQETISNYFVMYSSASQEDVFRYGFSTLLSYPEFQDGANLAPAVSLFENGAMLRGLLRETARAGSLRYWIGHDLEPYVQKGSPDLVFIAAPYRVADRVVGAIGLLGPMRVPYREVFSVLQNITNLISQFLTTLLMTKRVTLRIPDAKQIACDNRFALELLSESERVVK